MLIRGLVAVAVALACTAPVAAEELASFKTASSVQYMAWTADGKALATAANYGKSVKVYDPTGKDVGEFTLDKESVACMAVSADGKTLAAASTAFRKAPVRVWDIATQKATVTVTTDLGSVKTVALSPDGKLLAAAGGTTKGSGIELWNLAESPPTMKALEGHTAAIATLAFSPDGKTLASGGGDKTTKLWNLATLKGETVGPEQPGSVRFVTFSPDGKWLVSVSTVPSGKTAESVAFYNLTTKKIDTVLRGETASTLSIAFSTDMKTIATSHLRGEVKLWDVASGKETAVLKGHHVPNVVAFSPDGNRLATGGQELVVKVWPVAASDLAPADPTLFRGHTAPVRAVAYSPTGKFLATCSDDLTVKLWDPATGKESRTIVVLKQPAPKPVPKVPDPKAPPVVPPVPYYDAVVALSISPDGKQLAVTADTEVKLFDTATGGLDGTLKGHTEKVTAVAYAPAGAALATAAKTEVVLWKATTRKEVVHIPHDSPPSFAFTPDGAQLLTSNQALSGKGTMHVFDAAKGKQLGFTIDGQTKFLTMGVESGFSFAVSPTGKSLLIHNRLYDWATAKELWKLTDAGDAGISQGNPLRFSPSGRHIAGGKNGGVGIWDAETGKEVAFLDLDAPRRQLKNIDIAWAPDGNTIAISGPGQSAADADKPPTVGGKTKPPVDWSVKLWDVTKFVK